MSAVVDLRGLPPPLPMQRILDALEGLGAGQRYSALLPHEPQPLFPLLRSRGAQWRCTPQADGSVQITVWRDAGSP